MSEVGKGKVALITGVTGQDGACPLSRNPRKSMRGRPHSTQRQALFADLVAVAREQRGNGE